MKGTRFLFVLLIIAFLFFLSGNFVSAQQVCDKDQDCPGGQSCISDPCNTDPNAPKICGKGRALEICYPQIPGVATPKTTGEPLPDYINYIFRFAIAAIGFVVLGAMVYAGVSYFLSFNNAAKLQDAKEGISAAFLGGVILLAAFLIFNTINPQLTILGPPKADLLWGTTQPGIYICTYPVDTGYLTQINQDLKIQPTFGDLGAIIDAYTNETDPKRQVEATQALQRIMYKDSSNLCQLLLSSTNLRTPLLPNYTMFSIPKVFPDPNDPQKRVAEFLEAVILHEKDDFKGEQKLYPIPKTVGRKLVLFDQIDGFKAGNGLNDIGGRAKSITRIKKADVPEASPPGITLFSCPNWNQSKGLCPKGLTGTPIPLIDASFATDGADIKLWGKSELKSGQESLAENVRSIRITPLGSFLAIVYEKDDAKGNGGILYSDAADIRGNKLGLKMCGTNCPSGILQSTPFFFILDRIRGIDCTPCINSMTVIKGIKL
ncbi:MAG: hypothetical protein AAB565_01190 [Patescibacteria group bacterium]